MKALILALAVATAAVVPAVQAPVALAQQAPSPTYGPAISLADAQAIIDRAIRASHAGGHRMAIAIVEPSGELIAFNRMDDTQYGSTSVALGKARTAARYRRATAAFEDAIQSGRLVTLANDDVLPIGGGIPITVNGQIVGAIGVSGGTVAEDIAVANAALSAE